MATVDAPDAAPTDPVPAVANDNEVEPARRPRFAAPSPSRLPFAGAITWQYPEAAIDLAEALGKGRRGSLARGQGHR